VTTAMMRAVRTSTTTWARRLAREAASRGRRRPWAFVSTTRRASNRDDEDGVAAAECMGKQLEETRTTTTEALSFTLRVDETAPTPSRLDAYVSSRVDDPGFSRGRVAAAIKASKVRLNGRVERKPSRALKPGDVVEGALEPEPTSEATPEPWIELDVVYEDASVLVVNKPAGMVTHPSAGHASGTLVNAVLGHCELPELVVPTGRKSTTHRDGEDEDEDEDEEPIGGDSQGVTTRPGIVHRLDKGTSGVMVVAKDAAAHNSLCDQFAAREVRRRYVAILSGVPTPKKGRIEAPIGRDPRDRLRMAVTPGGGRFAASNYEVIATLANGNASLVEWRLETGRTHQIRVHAKHIGHPILGDDVYGGGGGSAVSALTRYGVLAPKEAKAILSKIDRPMLHARTLGFSHPRTAESLHFTRDPPDDFAQFAAALSLSSSSAFDSDSR